MTEHVCIRIQGGEVFCRCGWFGKANYGTAIMTLYGDHRAAAEREAWQARVDAVVAAYKADDSPSGELWDALADLAAGGPVEPPELPRILSDEELEG